MTDPTTLLPGERILWTGHPSIRAWARDILHLRWIALYFALFLIWNAREDRLSGLDPVQTLLAGLPLAILGLGLLASLMLFARSWARATTYTITTRRCLLSYGLALTATLSLPLPRLAEVAIALRADGTGDLALTLKPGPRIGFLKLWPHARPWRLKTPQPMLRGVPDAARLGALLTQAIAAIAPGHLHDASQAQPAPNAAMALAG